MLEQLLFDGMREMGLDPSREGVLKLIPYLEMMLDRNRSLNLTAVKDPDSAVRLHLLDALSLFQALPLSGRRGRSTQRHGANSRRLKVPEDRGTLRSDRGQSCSISRQNLTSRRRRPVSGRSLTGGVWNCGANWKGGCEGMGLQTRTLLTLTE